MRVQRFCAERDTLLLDSAVLCLRRMLGLTARVPKKLQARSKSESALIYCGDLVRVSMVVPKRWQLGARKNEMAANNDDKCVEVEVKYAGSSQYKHCVTFLEQRVAVPTHGEVADSIMTFDFEAGDVGFSVWEIRPVKNRMSDYFTLKLEVCYYLTCFFCVCDYW